MTYFVRRGKKIVHCIRGQDERTLVAARPLIFGCKKKSSRLHWFAWTTLSAYRLATTKAGELNGVLVNLILEQRLRHMVARIITVEPFDLVVFGGTGDLAYRKLFPALFRRNIDGSLTSQPALLRYPVAT